MNGAHHHHHHNQGALPLDVIEEDDFTVEEAIAGLADPDKARRLGMFQLLHEYVSGDTRKALVAGSSAAAWQAIQQASLFRPSWDGDQPAIDDLLCLESLSCVWAISAHEENKPLVVLYGGVDAVMTTFHKIKYEKGHPQWADFLQTMSAIVQNVCESHYDSGKKNDLHGVLVNKGVMEFLHFMVREPVFRLRDENSNELECIKFLLCLTIGNLAYNRIHRPLLEEIGAFAFLRNSLRQYKIVIKNSWRTLQPFVPLLRLVHDVRQGDSDPLWSVVTLAILCLEQFSSKFGERARHFLWRTFALNDTPETLRTLLMSPLLKRPGNEIQHEALLSLCKNMNLDIELLTRGFSAAPALLSSSPPLRDDLPRERDSVDDDLGVLFNRREMFADLVLAVPRHDSSSSSASSSSSSSSSSSAFTSRTRKGDVEGDAAVMGRIYCHRAIMSARCKVFAALLLRWDRDRQQSVGEDEEEEEGEEERGGNGKESGEEKDRENDGSGDDDDDDDVDDDDGEEEEQLNLAEGAVRMEEDEDIDMDVTSSRKGASKPERKAKSSTAKAAKSNKAKAGKGKGKAKSKAKAAKDAKKKRKRGVSPEHKHLPRRRREQQANHSGSSKGGLQTIVVRDVEFDTMYKIVEFIYKGRVELDEACVVDVLRAADIYGLDALKLRCEAFLADSLDLDNIAKLLEIANVYSAWYLEKRCQEYIRFTYNGHFAKVVESALFADLFERMPHFRESLAAVCDASLLQAAATSVAAASATPPVRTSAAQAAAF